MRALVRTAIITGASLAALAWAESASAGVSEPMGVIEQVRQDLPVLGDIAPVTAAEPEVAPAPVTAPVIESSSVGKRRATTPAESSSFVPPRGPIGQLIGACEMALASAGSAGGPSALIVVGAMLAFGLSNVRRRVSHLLGSDLLLAAEVIAPG